MIIILCVYIKKRKEIVVNESMSGINIAFTGATTGEKKNQNNPRFFSASMFSTVIDQGIEGSDTVSDRATSSQHPSLSLYPDSISLPHLGLRKGGKKQPYFVPVYL